MDLDAFAERAAIKEFCAGMSRFRAETEAAAEQGMKRWEVLDAIRNGNPEPARDHGSQMVRDAANDLPAVQRRPKEENRSLFGGDVQAGRNRMVLPSLRS